MQDKDNTALLHLENFDLIINPDKKQTTFFPYSIPLFNVLPEVTRSFFRYNGSLTTPGCDEDVIWTIFDTPIAISERQVSVKEYCLYPIDVFLTVYDFLKLNMLRRLKDDDNKPMVNNYRPVQELNDRKLFYRPVVPTIMGKLREQLAIILWR